jgi:hypothetical protein
MKVLFLLAMSLSTGLFAAERATHASLADLLEVIRDPAISSSQRRDILDFFRQMMAKKLAEEHGLPEEELNLGP